MLPISNATDDLKCIRIETNAHDHSRNAGFRLEREHNRRMCQLRIFSALALLFVLVICVFFVKSFIVCAQPRMRTNEINDAAESISCSSLNVSTLRLITFDLFGVLMLTESSLNRNIAAVLPSLSLSDVQNFTSSWLNAYRSYFGKSFPPSLTHQPFQWVIHSSLLQILDSFNLSKAVPEGSDTFNALKSSWGKLQPRPGAVKVLKRLGKKYQLGVLSNGDQNTLKSVLNVFSPSIEVPFILSSDYPVNCFKDCSAMYAQALAAVDNDVTKVLHVASSAYDTHGALVFGIFSGALDKSAIHTIPTPCFAFENILELLSFFNV